MDELLHHCLRELSFDGDLGCNVSRLNDFIAGFYAHSGRGVPQNSDGPFCSFIWSLVVQHPTAVVGLVPEGVNSEVWIAPQISAKRKAKASGLEHVETSPAHLEPVPNSKSTPLDELVRIYGDRLRIAVNADAIFAAITGSHIRSSRMSPMVYTALQIITRGRDEGVTVVQLGQQSKYDQKTCFYLVRQLTEMDLVAKVRRGGVGTHFCIHKYFYDRSPSWQAIREEETQAEDVQRKVDQLTDADDDDEIDPAIFQFTPIDSRHLSSLPLVKARVIKLLKASQNHIHASNNLLITLGFLNPTKTDRRFFQSRIRELIQQGVIEKVIVPSNRKKANGSSVKCFRLVSDIAGRNGNEDGVVVQPDDEKDDDIVGDESGVKANITIHKQIIDLLEDSGTTGMTLNELSSALANFDKRTIELFLARAEKCQPPKHLADLGIAGLMETSGRERRHRYYTVAAYQKLVVAEQLDKSSAGFGDIEIKDAGGFSSLPPSLFFREPSDLQHFQDTFNRATRLSKRQLKNPVLPDGTVKQGRPRKAISREAGDVRKGTKRKRDVDSVEGEERGTIFKTKKVRLETSLSQTEAGPVTKKRGRPRKVQVADPGEGAAVDGGFIPSVVQPKTRGRAQKRKAHIAEEIGPPNDTKRPRRDDQVGALDKSIERSEAPPVSDVVQDGVEMAEAAARGGTAPQVEENIPIPPPLSEAQPQITSSVDTATSNPEPASLIPSVSREILVEHSNSSNKTPKAKGGRGRVNVSHLRRENEILRVLEEAGGIVNIQTKEFYEAHTALLEVLATAGEPTSAPVGTRTDKRTATLTIEGLENKGKVKQLKTSVATHTGVNKPANVVYLPSVSREQLNAFFAGLARGLQPSISSSTAVKIQEPVEYGADASVSSRGILPLQLLQLEQPGENKRERWSKNVARADQLFAYDDATIRDVLLAERTTLGQLYGFIVGKAARAREFHTQMLGALGSGSPSPNIIPGSRIVELSYYSHEIPVRLFTAYVSALTHSELLTNLLKTEEGRKTPVKYLPTDLHAQLQVGRSRARSRILDILELLLSLQLVTPLKPSTTGQAWVTCQRHEHHPTAFDIATDHTWTSSTPQAAPSYWYFNTAAPLYVWGASGADPPHQKMLSVATSESARDYWQLLKENAIDSYLPDAVTVIRPVEQMGLNASTSRSLRRSVSWNAGYVFTWHQMKFLEKSIDLATGDADLQEEDDEVREAKLDRLCWVTSAPRRTVEEYLQTARTRIMIDKEKLRNQTKETKRLKKLEETKVALARKAEEAKVNREREWSSLLKKVHPGDLGAAASRVERVHLRFMQAGLTRDLARWEKEVLDAIREAELVSNKILQVSGKRSIIPRLSAPTGEVAPSLSVSIKALIDQQQPLLDQGVYKRKPKTKKKAQETEVQSEERKNIRRHRFQWNKEYDELARDASVIIRARCRTHSRLDWTALEQVFPAVPRNTVRQRLSNIRETPGNESYLRRLEDRWYGLWIKHKGTDSLPDENPESASNFNLVQHIEFLRQNVDKNALRIGFGQEKEIITNIIHSDVASLERQYNVVEEVPTAPTWDFVWNAVVEEGREKRLLSQCLTTEMESIPYHNVLDTDQIMLAEAALKMVMGSPPENYNCDRASSLLTGAGEELVSKATQRLLGKGVLSKSQRDPQKQRPGRQLKISDSNQNAIGGFIPRDTYQDAVALLESAQSVDSTWRAWPLTATDGDAVALIHLVSEGLVEFTVDTTEPQAARQTLDWNSKRADDDQIETALSVKYAIPNADSGMDWQEPRADPDELEMIGAAGAPPITLPHGYTGSGGAACCRQVSGGDTTIDCAACLKESWASLTTSISDEENAAALSLLSVLLGEGKAGCRKDKLSELAVEEQLLPHIIQKLTEADIPLLYWVGYVNLVLVSSEYISEWSVVVSESPLSMVLPRRWLNIEGFKIGNYWQAALRAVMALVVFRPGISQAEIRWRLRSVYDRQEVIEVLNHLQTEGHLSLRTTQGSCSVCPLDHNEETTAFWFLGERCWFQV